MTDDEKRQQKANLLLESQEAEDNLSHLREKAHKLAEMYASIAEWLRSFASTGDEQFRSDTNALIHGSWAKYTAALNPQDAMKIVSDIEKAEGAVAQLKMRRQHLGLR